MARLLLTLVNTSPDEISTDDWEEVCSQILDEAISRSPVDTGFFQSQWELHYLSKDVYQIRNDASYASYLEDGWSKQAPSGVLAPIINKIDSIIRGVIGFTPSGDVYLTVEEL